MDVMIKTRNAFTVLGIQIRLNPMTTDFHALWQNEIIPRYAEIKPFAIEGGGYAVYYPTDEAQMVDMLAGVEVAAGTAAPAGLLACVVPAAHYAVVECRMDAIGDTWRRLYEEWPPQPERTIDFTKPSFEYYSPNMESGDGLVSIWIPVLDEAA